MSIVLTAWIAVAGLTPARICAEEVTDATRERPRPTEFYSIFNFGYGGDDFPADDAAFEKIVRRLAEEGRFNAILCGYTERRAEICERYGMKMMVDLLNDSHHVYQNPAAARALCVQLRNHPVIMGYHLWSDRMGSTGPGRARDIRNVQQWDPTHPTYAATYQTRGGIEHLAGSDIFGWYDFHWKRGIHRRLPSLLHAWRVARQHDTLFYELLATDSGMPGEGNFRRSLWSVNTGIACGMKGCLWFIGTRQMNPADGQWTQRGRDINRVNAEVLPLRHEILRLRNPVAIYTTPITRDMNNRPVGDGTAPVMPAGWESQGFPEDFWLQPIRGEFLMGVFRNPSGGTSVFVANHNAYAEQQVSWRLGRDVTARIFDRPTARWRELPADQGVIGFSLDAGGGELLTFE